MLKSFKDEMARLFILSFAVFLFILFFQPFPLGMLDYNNRLLYVTGFGAIYFFLSWLVLILLPISVPKWFNVSEWESGPPIILVILLLVITTTAYAFYVRYVGQVHLSMYIVFKLVLVCLLPLIILKMLYKIKAMETLIISMQIQNKTFQVNMIEDEKSSGEEEFEFISENKTDNFKVKFRNLVLIKSADNYVEIYYLENEILEKRLVRNTLKNIETQLSLHKFFIRCHRTRLVNIIFIDKLLRDFSGYYLKMSCMDEKIPVSRQFIMQLKDVISNKK
jgi:hypothetical protein